MYNYRSLTRAVLSVLAAAITCIVLLASAAFDSVFKTVDFAPAVTAQLERAAIEQNATESNLSAAGAEVLPESSLAREHSNLVKSLDRTPGIIKCHKGCADVKITLALTPGIIPTRIGPPV